MAKSFSAYLLNDELLYNNTTKHFTLEHTIC